MPQIFDFLCVLRGWGKSGGGGERKGKLLKKEEQEIKEAEGKGGKCIEEKKGKSKR